MKWLAMAVSVSGVTIGMWACGGSDDGNPSSVADAGTADVGSKADATSSSSGSGSSSGSSGAPDDAGDAATGPKLVFGTPYVDSSYADQGKIIIQSDGKIVFASSDVRRYTSDFKPDTTFGNNGVVKVAGAAWYDIAAQPDGKIIVAGAISKTAAIARISGTDGSMDTSFGSNGIASIPAPFYDSQNTSTFNSIVIQGDGKVVVGGNFTHWLSVVGSGFSNSYAVVARYSTAGGMDSSFNSTGPGGGGVLQFAMNSYETNIALLSSGKILFYGSGPSSGGNITQIRTDGTPDPAFGTSGSVNPLAAGVTGFQMAVQADGKVLLNGGTNGIFRLNADASVDTSFGVNGVAMKQDQANIVFGGQDLHIAPDGKIVSTGSAGSASPYKLAVLRLNADGTRDPALQYGKETGIAAVDLPAPYSTNDCGGSSLAFDKDGSVVVAGVITLLPSFNQMPVLARLK